MVYERVLIMRSKISLAVFTLLCPAVHAQVLTFSPEVTLLSNDKAVAAVADVWSRYIDSFGMEQEPGDSIRAGLWGGAEPDILLHAMSHQTVLYRVSEQFTFSIRTISDRAYEINTIAQFKIPVAEGNIVFQIYKVLAAETDGQFRLFNYFDAVKPGLNHYRSNCVDFYYPKSLEFDTNEFDRDGKFVETFKRRYGIEDHSDITYLIGHNVDEAWSLLGVSYSVARSEKPYAGYTLFPRVVLTARPDHCHELVHAVMIPLYPRATSLMHEGIATYYGGTSGRDYGYHVKNLKQYMAGHDIAFSDYSAISNHPELPGGTNLQYLLGALIVEYALENYGTEKVLRLFDCNGYEQIFEELGVKQKEIDGWVHALISRHK